MPEVKLDQTTSLTDEKDKKKSGLGKLWKAIINDDFDKIGEALVTDILIPAFKNTCAALGKNFIDMVFFGESRGDYYGKGASGYHSSYKSGNNHDAKKAIMDMNGDYFIFASPAIATRGDAERILYKLNKILDEWDYVKVPNLYELVNEIAPYTYNEYGWKNLTEAKALLGPDGYYIRLPKPIPINRR